MLCCPSGVVGAPRGRQAVPSLPTPNRTAALPAGPASLSLASLNPGPSLRPQGQPGLLSAPSSSPRQSPPESMIFKQSRKLPSTDPASSVPLGRVCDCFFFFDSTALGCGLDHAQVDFSSSPSLALLTLRTQALTEGSPQLPQGFRKNTRSSPEFSARKQSR